LSPCYLSRLAHEAPTVPTPSCLHAAIAQAALPQATATALGIIATESSAVRPARKAVADLPERLLQLDRASGGLGSSRVAHSQPLDEATGLTGLFGDDSEL
jgi:hypothetical protein